jgi:copper chaperone CopZ
MDMKKFKTLKIILASLAGIFLLLTAILVAHIATAKPVEIDNATLQISRIDFKEPLDASRKSTIRAALKSIDGVKTEHFNLQKGVLVYFHDNKIVDSKTVFEKITAAVPFEAIPFEASEDLASKKVCPAVSNTNSFGYKFSRGIQRIFN